MKEIIYTAAMIVGLYLGTPMLKQIHDWVRTAALEKAHTGLPSLTELTHAIRGEGHYKKGQKEREANQELVGRHILNAQCLSKKT